MRDTRFFEGRPVPAGMVRYLRAARRMGWTGRPITNQAAIREAFAARADLYNGLMRQTTERRDA